VTVLLEGLRFLWSITPRRRLLPSRAYLLWRLGTVYGSFNRETGEHRTLRELLGDLWRDRANVVRFLRWRRDMRHPRGHAANKLDRALAALFGRASVGEREVDQADKRLDNARS